jgi:hypothetical protein
VGKVFPNPVSSAYDAVNSAPLKAAQDAYDTRTAQARQSITGGSGFDPAVAAGNVASFFMPLPGEKARLAETLAADAPKLTISGIRQAAQDAYKAVDNSGISIDPKAAQSIISSAQDALANFGFHPQLQPKANAALNAVSDTIAKAQNGGNPITLKGMDTLRKLTTNAISGAGLDKSDKAASYIVRDSIDNFVNNLSPDQTFGTANQSDLDQLANARDLWSRSAKAQAVQDVLTKAQNSASGFAQWIHAGRTDGNQGYRKR